MAMNLLEKLKSLNLYEAEEEGWHVLLHEGEELPFVDKRRPRPHPIWGQPPPTDPMFTGVHLPSLKDKAGFRPADALEILCHAGTDRVFRSISLIMTWIPSELEVMRNTGNSNIFLRTKENWVGLREICPIPRTRTILVRVNGYMMVADPVAARSWPSPCYPGLTTPKVP
jgi:hypothetical protein